MKNQYCRIVPPEHDAFGLTLARGTRVVLPDGTELHGVTKIELLCHVNDIWRARIECCVDMQPVAVLAQVHCPRPWWKRLLSFIWGTLAGPAGTGPK